MSEPCICFAFTGGGSAQQPTHEWSEVVMTARGWATRYKGWATDGKESLIYYGNDREHAEEQSDAMNLFLVRKLIERHTT